jgi:putative DNA primase/helicase
MSKPEESVTDISHDAVLNQRDKVSKVRRAAAALQGPSTLHVAEVEPWAEAVDGAALLEDMRGVLRRFVVLPTCAAETLALWVLHTYGFQLRNVTTYVGIASPEKRCGKTTLLTVLSEMVNRPVVAANISSPAFFRVIEETQPTLLIDEADTFLQGNDELRGILNSGYSRKTAYVVRVGNWSAFEAGTGAMGREGEAGRRGKTQLARYSCWCPKVMAAIGRLPETLADRCIVITMQRKAANEECERLRNLDASELRRKCARFVMDHAGAIASARPEIPSSLNDRAADIWEPLLVLADLAGGEWPKLAREAAVSLTQTGQENNPIGSLLLDILLIFANTGQERIFSRTLVEALNGFEDRPWAEIRNGKEISELWLAQQLRPYGIRPRTIWIGERAAKGYLEEDFAEVFPRYIPISEVRALVRESEEVRAEKSSSSG